MGATVANGTLVMSFTRNSGNGMGIIGIDASDGSVEYYYEITDNSTGANNYNPNTLGKNPDETFIYACSGKTVFALPADGSILRILRPQQCRVQLFGLPLRYQAFRTLQTLILLNQHKQ